MLGTVGWTSQSMAVGTGISDLQLHQDVVAFDLDLIDGQIGIGGGGQGLAGLDVELRGVQRAFDAAVFQPAFAEQRIFVRANIVGRVKRPIEIVDSDFLAADAGADRTAPCRS